MFIVDKSGVVTGDLVTNSIYRSTKKRDAKNDVPLDRKNFRGQF